MLLGVIADDFTGATDIASFLVENGIATIQLNGVPQADIPCDSEAVVISLKIRSCPPAQAVDSALAALRWLRQRQCQHVYFKYCSTFDSTARGNIGPVTDALLAALNLSFTVLSPALPVNGRTLYQGYLFVGDQLLAESGMRQHPVNPMTDSYIPRLLEAQGSGRCQVIPYTTLEQGAQAVRDALMAAEQAGYRYAVLDALNERHLEIQGQALCHMPLVTGGSGLAIGLARQWCDGADASRVKQAQQAGYPLAGRGVVLAGSCSVMTNRQVARYCQQAPAQQIEVARCLDATEREHYAQRLAQWCMAQSAALAPMLYATQPPQALAEIQQRYGAQAASEAVELLFAQITRQLAAEGISRFIVAGGETSGVVTSALQVQGFHIGPVISPGVPWVTATDRAVSLALKSGNFGDENFFARAQTEFPL